MKLHSITEIQAPAENIWPILVEPEFLPEWNDKIVTVKAHGTHEPAAHSQYRFTFRMSKKETNCEATLTRFDYLEKKFRGYVASVLGTGVEIFILPIKVNTCYKQ